MFEASKGVQPPAERKVSLRELDHQKASKSKDCL